MGYDQEEFWKKYKDYVDESYSRHRCIASALNILAQEEHTCNDVIFDLGCGQIQEASLLFDCKEYYGADQMVDDVDNLFKLDYRYLDDENKLFMLLRGVRPTTICSLFSSEITDEKRANYDLYQKIFDKVSSVKRMFLAGFYYTDKMNSSKVEETGGLISWQTLDLQDQFLPSIRESRIYSEAPSELFGPNVIEVWKLLERRV